MKAPVKVGYCGALAEMDAISAAGFDYMEVRASEVAGLSATAFQSLAAKAAEIELPVLSANYFVPAHVKITGPRIDPEQQMEYVRRALDRVSQLGVQTVVFGSGGARQVPDGFSREEAFDQLVNFGKRIAPEARLRHIVIAIEPLCRLESNLIRTSDEAAQWVKAVNDPYIQLMIDFYHFTVEGEAPAGMHRVKEQLRFLHMANPNGRVLPQALEEYHYTSFTDVIQQIYDQGLISLEAPSRDLRTEGPPAIRLMRRLFTNRSV